jgi:hypothetical protein
VLNNFFAVDRAHIVSVKALKNILHRISILYRDKDQNWWIAKETRNYVTIAHSTTGFPWIAERSFRFPKVAHIKLFGEDGEMVCMHPYTSGVELRSMSVHRGKLKWAEDWEPFWEPIKDGIRDWLVYVK